MLTIPETPFRVYSAAGIARVMRKDELLKKTQTSPSVSVGLTYNMTKHLMTEFALNYTAGYGEAELNTCNSYIPFLYSGTFGLAYRF